MSETLKATNASEMAQVKLNMPWVVATESRELLVMPSRLFSATCEVTADCNPQLAKTRGALGWASLRNTVQQLRSVQIPLAVLKVWSISVNEVGKEELSTARKTEWCQGALNQVGVLVYILQALCFPLIFGWKLTYFSYAAEISVWVFRYKTWKVNGLLL